MASKLAQCSLGNFEHVFGCRWNFCAVRLGLAA
jgi:hypothetical protein